ncbi:MAG: NADH-quinone oxidoreductase subunit J [Candidatus Velthaea sp.]
MIGFWVLALAVIATGVFTITARKPVYSVVGLLGNFLALAILYVTLNAEFLAVIQLVVYSGAILILFLFVIALLSSGTKPFDIGPDRAPRIAIPAFALGVIGLGAVVYTIVRAAVPGSPTAPPGVTGEANAFGSVNDFGVALFTKNLLPFEVTALILMVAVVGVVLLAGDERPAPPRRRPKARDLERESIVKPVERSAP